MSGYYGPDERDERACYVDACAGEAAAADAGEAEFAQPIQRRRFGLVRWFQPETLVARTRQETAMRAGLLRRPPTCFADLDTKEGDL